MTSALGTQDLTWTSNSNRPGVGGGLSSSVADIADYATINPTTKHMAQYNGRLDADVTGKDHAAVALYVEPITSTNDNGGARPYDFFNHNETHDALSISGTTRFAYPAE